MAQLNLIGPMGLYGALHSVEKHIEAREWPVAQQWSADTSDEGRRLMGLGQADNQEDWQDFMTGAGELQLAIKAHDSDGCRESLASLRAALNAIAGPETGPAV